MGVDVKLGAIAVANIILLFFNLLFLVRPVHELLSNPSSIPQGLATLIGAVVGLCTIAWQTNRGFKNLIASQEHRAELDRQALKDKSELDQRAKQADRHHEARVVAAALNAELNYIIGLIDAVRENYSSEARNFRNLAAKNPASTVKVTFTDWKTPIYDENIKRLGLLGWSLAGDVVEVYSLTTIKSSGKPTELPARSAAFLYEAFAHQYGDWRLDMIHVAQRLGCFQHEQDDPGALAAAREARSKQG